MEILTKLGDITEERVDAIVNAANNELRRGSGVCGAIHAAAGPELEQYCLTLGGCATGEAVITPGFNLPAKYVIHTVGPRYGQTKGLEAELLKLCYKNSLKLADEHKLESITFPAISTGVYDYPVEEAAKVCAQALHEFKLGKFYDFSHINHVTLIFRTESTKELYESALGM